MSKKRFYGVAGINGYGVFDDYDKVLEKKPYIGKFKIKGFQYYKEAEAYAINTYQQLVYSQSDAIKIHEIKRKNRFYHGHLSRRQNRERSFFDNHRMYNDNDYKPLIRPFSVEI